MDSPKADNNNNNNNSDTATGRLLANFSPQSSSFFSATTAAPGINGHHWSFDRQVQSDQAINQGILLDAANYGQQPRAASPRNGKLALPFGLLLASLCASVANTLLLSFVLKSVQISESGPINGLINWNKDTQTTNIEIPVELKAGRRLALNSIDSREAKRQLSFLIDRRPQYQANIDRVSNGNNPDRAGDAHHSVNEPTATTSGEFLATTNSCCSSLSANNASSMSERAGKLEVTTKLLQLWLQGAAASGGTGNSNSNSNNKTSARRLLIELQADQDSAWLASGEHLERQASSLLVGHHLHSPQLTGSLRDPLSLQAIAGNLIARSRRELQVRARSGPIGLTASEHLLLEAPTVRLAANGGGGLYIDPDSVRYFGEADLELEPAGSLITATDKLTSGQLEPPREPGQLVPLDTDLEAYNLVVRGNLLLASNSRS